MLTYRCYRQGPLHHHLSLIYLLRLKQHPHQLQLHLHQYFVHSFVHQHFQPHYKRIS
jgi:hypothetical protein